MATYKKRGNKVKKGNQVKIEDQSTTAEVFNTLDETASRSEQWVEKNQKIIFGGLIAEEVHDAGLTEFVQYNDDDEPDALAYGNMVSLCIKAIQELKAELDSAKARITALENGE